MRAGLLATLGAVLALVAAGCGGSSRPTYPIVIFIAGQKMGSVAPGESAKFFQKTLRIGLGHGHAIINVPNGAELVDKALAARQGRIDLKFTPVQTLVQMQAQTQELPHGSELAALSMVLSLDGVKASQSKLASQLKLSPPTKQEPIPGSKLFRWGDPEKGFVGEPSVPGPKGGYGVYEPEIKRLAAKYGVPLTAPGAKTVDAVQNAVLYGHPVIAWVGGATAQPSSWLTPSGTKITADLGEHAVVLVGADRHYLVFEDPSSGGTFKWKLSEFKDRWDLIGDRALVLP